MPKPPPSVIAVAIEARSRLDRQRLGIALSSLTEADPSLHVSIDAQSDQILLEGQSERQLDAAISSLRTSHQIDLAYGAPQVNYQETITREGLIEYTHKKRSGDSGEFARVKLRLIPGQPGSGFLFAKTIEDPAPQQYIAGIEKGLEGARGSGMLAGFPIVDMRVELVDCAFHATDSSALAFESASHAAFREGLRKCRCVLLQPIMRVEVTARKDHIETIATDLRSRRGSIQSSQTDAEAARLQALVPLANMFGYVNNLRAMSQGRGAFVMEFSHYERVAGPEDDPPSAPAVAMRR